MLAGGVVEWETEKNPEGGGAMADYIVTAEIRLEVEARNEAEAKQIAMEDISDFMRHNSFASLMKAKKQSRVRPKP